MQRERGSLDSFPETIDLNQGSFPNNNAMDQSAPWDNILNPVENRLSNYMLAPRDGNTGCTNTATNFVPGFSGWDHGESSSSANNLKEGACGDDSDMRLEWSSPFNACPGTNASSEDWSFQPSNINNSSYVGNGRSMAMQNYSSPNSSLNSGLNHGHVLENDYHIGLGIGLPHTLYKSGHSESEPMRTFHASSSNIGTSGSSSSFLENNDASGPSVGTWGSSCKRKALDGTSGQFYPGGSSSSNQPMENIPPHSIPGCYPVPENLSISSGLLNLSPPNHLEQLNPRNGVGMSRGTPSFFPSSIVPGIAETSTRNFAIRSSLGHREPVPYDTPRGVSFPQLSRPVSNIDSFDLRPLMNPSMNQPHFMRVNEARGMHSNTWNESFSSRGGRSSSSFLSSGERGSGTRVGPNIRSSFRNNLEYPVIVSAPESINVLQDQIDWSFAPGTSATSRHQSSASQISQSSGGRASSVAWLPHQSQTSQTHQTVSDAASWIPFPRIESDAGTRRNHLAFLPSGSSSSSSDEAAMSSRVRQQPDQRSTAFLMDVPGDDVRGWRGLAAVEGRHRLIRQVLSAMRRGVHLQAEDYVLIDPFLNGFAELHDRHRDMRLDVDNMSYEELLALEERIGNVSTGLSEDKIRAFMRQRKYEPMRLSANLEPCCICQENYVAGDDIGVLDCGHEFHTSCIKQWLMLKNICPICKMTALQGT